MRALPINDNDRERGRVRRALSDVLIWCELSREEKLAVLRDAEIDVNRLHDKLERYGYE